MQAQASGGAKRAKLTNLPKCAIIKIEPYSRLEFFIEAISGGGSDNMDKFPEIYKFSFGSSNRQFSKRYAAVNSVLIREIISQLSPEGCWRINIADFRKGDSEPHYVLEFGHDLKTIARKIPREELVVDYCDTWSNPDTRSIEQYLGHIKIMAAGNFGRYAPRRIAIATARFYAKVLERSFPEHYLYLDEEALGPIISKE